MTGDVVHKQTLSTCKRPGVTVAKGKKKVISMGKEHCVSN